MVSQKGHMRILEILKDLDRDFVYTIVGDGAERKNILRFIKEYGLSNKIKHIPFTKNVEEFLSNSDLMLSGSYVEGFPNVFLESCAVGTPILAFAAPGGINEIILNGKNGYVVSNKKDFSKKLLNFKVSDWNSEEIRESVTSRYSEKIILSEYENLFRTFAVAKNRNFDS